MAITIGDIMMPSNIPNFVQTLFNGVNKLELIRPRVKNIDEIIKDHILTWL